MEDAYKRYAFTGVRYALYALALTPLVFSGHFLFPYISARTVYFRVIIELALLALLALWWRYRLRLPRPASSAGGRQTGLPSRQTGLPSRQTGLPSRQTGLRPEHNYFLVVFGLFVAANVISSFFSFSLTIAWFSDIERMWGVFTLIHLFLFYILLRSFFGGEQWRIFLNISLAVSLFVAGYGIVQHYPDVFGAEVFAAGSSRIISTLGNSAYVAIYMVFNIFFALFLLFKTKNKWLKFFYIFSIIINFFAFNLAGIRGTTLGLLAGITVAALAYILLGKTLRYKAAVAAVLCVGAAAAFYTFTNPQSTLAQSNVVLRRIASIELAGSTTETRFIGWRAAWQGFSDHPVFGVGMDNYATVFNKYFDADYYLYAPSEPYFDRSHNAWLDVLVMNGAVGFIIFLSFVFFIFYYLTKGLRQRKIKLDEFLLFTALSVTYFVHLIFVFDDLNSYMYFVVLLAFVEYRYRRQTLIDTGEERTPSASGYGIAAGAAAVAVLAVLYIGNIKVALATSQVIDALQHSDAAGSLAAFDKAFDYDIGPSRNIVLTYVNQLTQWMNQLQSIRQNPQQSILVQQALARGHEVLAKEITKDPYNALLYNRQAVLYNMSYLLAGNPLDLQNALDANNKSIELSREHLQYYYTLADTYLVAGDTTQALETVKTSLRINSRYRPGFFHLLRMYLADGQLEQALHTADILVKQNYTDGTAALLLRLAEEFAQQNRREEYLQTLQLARELYPADGEMAARLMREYLRDKNYDAAIALADDIKEINEGLRAQAEYLIKEIKAGRGEDVLAQMEEGR